VLAQERLIERVRRRCLADERIEAALMYGSFAQGAADEHSDIEFWLFFAAGRGTVDPRAWCAAIAPVNHLTVNEFGTHVAFFPGLIRGEFHFATVDDIAGVRSWPARGAAVDDMVVLDRTGALGEALAALPAQAEPARTADDIDALCGRFANWLVLALHVTRRGEYQRALDALSHARRHLLWLARLVNGQTAHWLTPSRSAEAELPASARAAIDVTAGGADPDQLAEALRASWVCGRAYWSELGARTGRGTPAALFAELDAALTPARPVAALAPIDGPTAEGPVPT